MKIDSLNILGELERLGAAFPWETVNLQLEREPAGKVKFTAYIPGDTEKGVEYVFGYGDSPSDSVTNAIKKSAAEGPREPESLRQKHIARLEEALAKLKAAEIPTLPPFKPNRELAAGSLSVPETVEV